VTGEQNPQRGGCEVTTPREPENRSAPTWQRAAAEVAEERARIEGWTAELASVRTGAIFIELDHAGGLSGRTGLRWARARQAAEAADSMLGRLSRVVQSVERVLALPDRGDADLARVWRLLHGDAIELAPSELPAVYRRPPGSESSEPRLSVVAVNRLVSEGIRTLRSTVDEISAALARTRPRLDELTARCRTVAAAAEQDTDAAARVRLDEIAARLEEERTALATDPLRLSPDDTDRLDDIAAQLADVDANLASSVRQRAELADRISCCAKAIGTLRDEESYAREVLSDSRRDALSPQGPVLFPAETGQLRARLSAVRELLEHEWRTLPGELDEIERGISQARQAAKATIAHARDAGAGAEICTRPEAVCTRPDCPGPGSIDEATGLCADCFRAPSVDQP
jgi:prefoldin subunit 5